MFKWLKKLNNANLPTEIPNINELSSITKEDCLKAIFKTLKEHKASCSVTGIIDDELLSLLKAKGYKVKKYVNVNNFSGITIDIVKENKYHCLRAAISCSFSFYKF